MIQILQIRVLVGVKYFFYDSILGLTEEYNEITFNENNF